MENMILGENPRPDLMRKDTLVLNGLWDYGVNSTGEEEYDSKILVPFSPETERKCLEHEDALTRLHDLLLDVLSTLRAGT